MRMMTTCTLIAFSPDAHEVGTDPVSTRRKVKCQEMSLRMADRYQAGGEGLAPEARLLIPYDREVARLASRPCRRRRPSSPR